MYDVYYSTESGFLIIVVLQDWMK